MFLSMKLTNVSEILNSKFTHKIREKKILNNNKLKEGREGDRKSHVWLPLRGLLYNEPTDRNPISSVSR